MQGSSIRRSSITTVVFLMVLGSCEMLCATGFQEIDAIEKRDPVREQENKKAVDEILLGKKKQPESCDKDCIIRSIEREQGHYESFAGPPPDYGEAIAPYTWVTWKSTTGSAVDVSGSGIWAHPQPNITDIDFAELDKGLIGTHRVIHNGAVPRSGRQYKLLHETNPSAVIVTSWSNSHKSKTDILNDAVKGARGLNPSRTKVLSALPYEATRSASDIERIAMNIQGSRVDWLRLNRDIQAASGDLNYVPGLTRSNLIEELAHGKDDLIVLYAHYANNVLYLPGKDGELISLDEISRLRRTPPIRRTIVLIACNTATTPSNDASLVDTLIQNGLADSVFGYAEPISAALIPSMIHKAASGVPLHTAFQPLQQFVLNNPTISIVPSGGLP